MTIPFALTTARTLMSGFGDTARIVCMLCAKALKDTRATAAFTAAIFENLRIAAAAAWLQTNKIYLGDKSSNVSMI
jgi:hypothetical protein